ncbi:nitrous oxide reductase family maturation protein NosD [Paenibacillus sp. JSM ZJ436]|uniref:nitrous oxide reductase family maturation protein NosD n=1 Tax=Paenibacillus sp. JSM ZJ436 TaxID=3376190 RepID=UPI0037B30DCC
MQFLRPGTVLRAFLLLTVMAAVLLPLGMSADAEESPVPLQPLLDQAQPGEILTLEPTTYSGPAVIDKPLTLQGKDVKIVNETSEPVLTLLSSGINLEGMNLVHLHRDPAIPAVLLQQISESRLSGLTIKTLGAGVNLRQAKDITLRDMTILGSQQPGSSRGNAMDLLDSSGITITGSDIQRMQDGIYVEGGSSLSLVDNEVSGSRYGFHLMFTKDLELLDNRGFGNITGAMVMSVRQASIQNNRFEKQSQNVNAQGLLLFEVYDSTIAGNIAEGNRVGFYIQGSENNRLLSNELRSNFIGIQMLSSADNVLHNNTLTANVVAAQAVDSSGNTSDGNYWDSAPTLDVDGSGFSGLPYSVNPFFLQISGPVPPFQLLFQSPGMPVLEQLFQSGAETWLRDAAPLLEPPASRNAEGEAETGVLLLSLLLLGVGSATILKFRRFSS